MPSRQAKLRLLVLPTWVILLTPARYDSVMVRPLCKPISLSFDDQNRSLLAGSCADGAVAGLVGIRVGVVSGVINLESSGVEASDWRLRHDQAYHEA